MNWLIPTTSATSPTSAQSTVVSCSVPSGTSQRTSGLSGEGYCYIDTGAHTSARGKGDFFTLPHPEIHLTPPSSGLHHEKKQEEQDWRALWERKRKASVTR